MSKSLEYVAAVPLFFFIWVSMAAAQEKEPSFGRGELHQILAPIALYPDGLLSQILMAATYPLEIVAAARWSRNNPGLDGQRAVDAVADRDWDPSVKALVAFPRVLERMSEDLEWTQRLGDAFLLDEARVMDAVQDLRHQALAAGNLDAMEHARAHRQDEKIVIEPATPAVVYVPYYHPRVIYGGWLWPAFPPVFWGPPPGLHFSTAFVWGPGVRVAPGFFFSAFHWPRRHVTIVHRHVHPSVPRIVPHRPLPGPHKWRHDPKHRRGVAYRHGALERSFPRPSSTSWSSQRESRAFRSPSEWQRPERRRDRDEATPRRFGNAAQRSPAGQAHGWRDGRGAPPQGRSVAPRSFTTQNHRSFSDRNAAIRSGRPSSPSFRGNAGGTEGSRRRGFGGSGGAPSASGRGGGRLR